VAEVIIDKSKPLVMIAARTQSLAPLV